MSDFYSVLRQSIIDRGLATPEERDEAYAQARRAMINRLWAHNPPLAEDEIDQRVGQFDIAVAEIEDEVLELFGPTAEVAPHDDDAGHLPLVGAEGQGEAGRFDDAGDDEPPARAAPAPRRRSIDDTSRAVERALMEAEREAELAARNAEAAEAAEGTDWSDEDDSADVSDAAARPEPKPEPRGAAAPTATPKPGAKALRLSVPALSEQSRLRLLVGLVVALSIVLVGGIVWMALPGPAPAPGPAVVLQTEVPGGVSDPDTAIRLPKEAIAVTSSFSLFDGQDPTVFESDPDNPVRFDGQLARISTSSASAGAKVIIGAGLSSRLAGKTVRVTLDARSARENGATSMRFAYQSGVAISHWQTANLGADFTPLGLVWRVPTLRTDPTGDYIVIEPGLPGSGTGVEIRSVRIDLVDQ